MRVIRPPLLYWFRLDFLRLRERFFCSSLRVINYRRRVPGEGKISILIPPPPYISLPHHSPLQHLSYYPTPSPFSLTIPSLVHWFLPFLIPFPPLPPPYPPAPPLTTPHATFSPFFILPRPLQYSPLPHHPYSRHRFPLPTFPTSSPTPPHSLPFLHLLQSILTLAPPSPPTFSLLTLYPLCGHPPRCGPLPTLFLIRVPRRSTSVTPRPGALCCPSRGLLLPPPLAGLTNHPSTTCTAKASAFA